MKESIANRFAKTFHAWEEEFQMPQGDSAFILDVSGSLCNVATANVEILDEIPIWNITEEMMSRFFGMYMGNNASQHEGICCDTNDM